MSYVLISFESPHHTIKADKILEEQGITRVVFPIPREISRDCGMGLRLNQSDVEQAVEIFQAKGILYKHIFPVDDKDRLTLIDRLRPENRQS